jgi:aspartate/methionine/tyrosine aminotransferase
MAQDILSAAIHSPFARLREAFDGLSPGAPPIDLTIGEPKHPIPPMVMEELATAAVGFGKYPPINGTPELRGAIADWLSRRYGLGGQIDSDRHVHPLSGSREGLVSAMFPAIDRRDSLTRPAVLIPNPFYQAYLAAALASGAEPVYLDAPEHTGFLPDLTELEKQSHLLARTVAFYLCTPANPQGAVASFDYLDGALSLARRYDFMLFCDECYSEIYSDAPPPGALEVALRSGGGFANLLVFNSLSKRSSVPGLRSGFCAGDPNFIRRLSQFRNVAAPQMPLPTQAASTALWRDEAHVVANRALYAAKFDAATQILGNRFGRVRPDGGFFLWLKMSQYGGGEAAAVTLWKQSGVKVLPGAYLTQAVNGRSNPGADYIRIALVEDLATTRQALERVARSFE